MAIMGFIQNHKLLSLSDYELITTLESSLKGSKLLTPGSEEYSEKVQRWSDYSEKPAVCLLLCTPLCQELTGLSREPFCSQVQQPTLLPL